MKEIMIFILFFPIYVISQKELIVQSDKVNIRKSPNTSDEVTHKAKRFDRFIILEKIAESAINGITDNWYKIQIGNTKTGYIFGHFTSLKREGQVNKEMTLNDVSFSDCFHVIFDEIDFGDGQNEYNLYEDIIEDANRESKIYIGKKFMITYNDLFSLVSEYCNPDLPQKEILTPTILQIKMIN
jgi:hypothetical protein